jgi:anti-sigma regulatory factor (Ser/Thr protein kinase)
MAPPQEIVRAVHEDMSDELIVLRRFVTAVYARFDAAARTMTYVDCGHTHVLHYCAAQGRVTPLADDPEGPCNLPLGVLPHTRYAERVVPFARGDAFVLYSDGLTEAKDAGGAMFGQDALARTVEENGALGAQDLAHALRDAVTAFAGPDGIDDDLTCVVVRARSGGAARERLLLTLPAVAGQLERIRAFVDDACAGTEFPPEAVDGFRLALTEATSNVVRHAYAGMPPGDVQIEAEVGPRSLVFRLRDTGRAFDPNAVPPPDFEGMRSGGFGVFIIQQVFERIEYTRGDDGVNCLTLAASPPGRGEQR